MLKIIPSFKNFVSNFSLIPAVKPCTTWIALAGLAAIAAYKCLSPLFYINSSHNYQTTLLFSSVKNNFVSLHIIEDTINRGANVNATDDKGRTPLFYSLENGNLESCKLLLDRNADPNHRDKNGKSLLSIAIDQRRLEICQTLLNNGGKLSEQELENLKKIIPRFSADVLSLNQKVNKIEYFDGKEFKYLNKNSESIEKKPITVICIAKFDHILGNSGFGAISRYYFPQYSTDFYRKIAENHTIIRVTVNDKNDLVPLLQKINSIFNQKPLHWMLHGHGDAHEIALGENSIYKTNAELMMEISDELDEDATISLCGCKNGFNENNMAQSFSRYSRGRIVIASQREVSWTHPTFFSNGRPILYPRFEVDGGLNSKAYKDGELLVDEQGPIRSRL